MQDTSALADDAMRGMAAGRRRWIDVLLVAIGCSVLVAGSPLVGGLLAGFGLVGPMVHWSKRRRPGAAVYGLVPADLVESHQELVAAAGLAGVDDGPRVLHAADDALIEVAALLVGRPPRGGAQRRFVDARLAALRSATAELHERHEAWQAAWAEVESLAATEPLAVGAAPASRPGLLVAVLVGVLLPLFVGWDLLRASGRGVVGLVDGLVLRMRTVARLGLAAGRCLGDLGRLARRRWDEVRTRAIAAARDARGRAVAARLRLRLRLRRRTWNR